MAVDGKLGSHRRFVFFFVLMEGIGSALKPNHKQQEGACKKYSKPSLIFLHMSSSFR